jgi:hypothetical protein
VKTVLPRIAGSRLQPLVDFYGQPEFRYKVLCDDIEAIPDSQPRKQPSVELAGILRRMKANLIANMAKAPDLFHAADPGQLGYCRKEKVQGCFNLSRMRITEEEFETLCAEFAVDGYPERFDYRKFCRALDPISMDRTTAKWEVSPEFERSKHDTKCYDGLHAIREKLNLKRMTPWPYFKSCTREKIRESEFRAKVATLNVGVAEEEVQAFIRQYGDHEGIAWRSFCTDIERTVFF